MTGSVLTREWAGDRLPDVPIFGPDGAVHVHDLCADSSVALYVTDVRRNAQLPRTISLACDA